ncbi:MAG: hypothetical protein ACRDF4_10885, partial [Rhabdochlamydiaceae bacterium]
MKKGVQQSSSKNFEFNYSAPLNGRSYHLPHHAIFTRETLARTHADVLTCKQEFTPADASSTPDDWDAFRAWLTAQFTSKEYVRSIVFKAREYYAALYDPRELSKLKAMGINTRKRILKALANRAKFEGAYDAWKETMRNANIEWDGQQDRARIIRTFLSQEGLKALQWLKEKPMKLMPERYHGTLIWIALSGLRPSEACKSLKLIQQLNDKGELDGAWDKKEGYYDPELRMLAHLKFPDTFFRGTKNAYITFVSPEVVQFLLTIESYSYDTLKGIFPDYGCLPVQASNLRANYATIAYGSMKKQELVDFVQGRMELTEFMKSYLRPYLLEFGEEV